MIKNNIHELSSFINPSSGLICKTCGDKFQPFGLDINEECYDCRRIEELPDDYKNSLMYRIFRNSSTMKDFKKSHGNGGWGNSGVTYFTKRLI